MRAVLAQIHYMPEHWTGNAHTHKVRDEFSLLFQFKAVYLLEELFSPLITPFILCIKFREKAQEIVDFFHNFTVEVVGVGDVCSFAQMDIRKHGNPTWSREEDTEASMYQQGENGKIEMSLMHFHLTNPEWKPPENCSMFLNDFKEQVHRDAVSLSTMQPDIMGAPYQSLGPGMMPSAATGIGLGYASLVSSVTGQSAMMSPSVNMSMAPFASGANPKLRGALSQCEGPMTGSGHRIMSSMYSSGGSGQGGPPTMLAPPTSILPPHSLSIHGASLQSQPTSVSTRTYDEGQLELLNNEMSFSALYMHDLRTRRARGMTYESMEDIRARALWQRHDSTQATPSSGGATPMPNIQEEDGAIEMDSKT